MLLRETNRVPLLFQGWVLRTKDLRAPFLIRLYSSARLHPAYWLASRILTLLKHHEFVSNSPRKGYKSAKTLWHYILT